MRCDSVTIKIEMPTRGKETIKTKGEINKIEKRKIKENINKTQSWSSETLIILANLQTDWQGKK